MTFQNINLGSDTIKRSTRFAFLFAGFSMAAWAPLVPFAKDRANLNSGELAILLLGLGVGSCLTMPLTGILVNRIGCKNVYALATVLIILTLPFLTLFSSFFLLLITLTLFGAGVGMADCVVNIQAIKVENASKENLMSGFHGFFSLGNVVGAAGITGLISFGLSPLMAIIFGVIIITIIFLLSYQNCLAKVISDSTSAKFSLPSGILLFLGILSFIGFLLEGAMLDWSAVFLVEEKQLATEYAGWGYVIFAMTITISRLSGTLLLKKFDYRNIITVGSLIAITGLLISIYATDLILVFLGYALVGLGIANLIPILFSLAGKQNIVPQHVAIPALTTIGYSGVLLGPAMIGFLANMTSLAGAFFAITILVIFVAISIRFFSID